MKARHVISVAVCVTLALLPAACKINKDTNCLNPKAACYKKDTEQPSVTSTTPASTPSSVTADQNPTLSTILFNFSEPMKNAEELYNYLDMTGPGKGGLQAQSVRKISDLKYELTLTGSVGSGALTFDLSKLTDLSGNALSPATMVFQNTNAGAVPDTVTSAALAYNQTNITWQNTTPDAMNYVVKIGGTDCATATAAAGGNVAGTVISTGSVVTNLAFGQFVVGANTVRICLTPVATGSATSFTVTVTRNETAPTINTIATGRVKIPYSISLTCTNVDRIVYTIDGSTPSFTVTSTGASVGAVAGGSSLAYSLVSGYSLSVRGSVPFRYLCIDKSGRLNTGGVVLATLQSKFVWDESNWSPVAPNDVWD